MRALLRHGLEHLRDVGTRGRVRWAVLVAGIVLVCAWQAGIHRASGSLNPTWKMQASTGVASEARFVRFYDRLGLWPVTTTDGDVPRTADEMRTLMRTRPETLRTEWDADLRWGDNGVLFLYLPSLWFGGPDAKPKLRPANALLFTGALLAVWCSFWWTRDWVLGGCVVAFAGSNPYQLLEVYGRDNLFGLPVTVFLATLAATWPVVRGRVTGALPVVATATALGVLYGLVRHVRTEPALLAASAALAILCASAVALRVRIAAVAALCVAAFFTMRAGAEWFRAQWDRANAEVAAVGGVPFTGHRTAYHHVWHTLWCGLGDFGADRGFAWDDRAAVLYARPIVLERTGVLIPTWPEIWANRTDTYRVIPDHFPGYADAIRERVVSAVRDDPVWFAGVLARRAARVASETTPVGLAAGAARVGVHVPFALVAALAAWFAAGGDRTCLLVAAMSLPLSLPALAIHSGGGMCWPSCFHLVVVAWTCAAAAGAVLARRAGRAAALGADVRP